MQSIIMAETHKANKTYFITAIQTVSGTKTLADGIESAIGSVIDTQAGVREPVPQGEAWWETTSPSNTGNHVYRSSLKAGTLCAGRRPHPKNTAAPGNTLICQ